VFPATLGADGKKSKNYFLLVKLNMESPILFKADIINSDTNDDKVRDKTIQNNSKGNNSH